MCGRFYPILHLARAGRALPAHPARAKLAVAKTMSDDPIFAITCLANAIFGGSIGALITWELCHAMDERGQCIGRGDPDQASPRADAPKELPNRFPHLMRFG